MQRLLSVMLFLLTATVSFAADAAKIVLAPLTQSDGYAIDCATGNVYKVSTGVKQEYTFGCGTVTSPPDIHTGVVTVVNLNPLSYATVATAQKVLAYVKQLVPAANVTVSQEFQYATPFQYTEPLRYVIVNGRKFVAGFIAAKLMQVGKTFTDSEMLAEFSRITDEVHDQ